MRRLPTVLLALTLPGAALAEEGDLHHIGSYWAAENMPVQWYMQEYLEDSLPNAANEDNGLIYQEEVLIKGYCNWKWTEYCDEILGDDWVRYEDAECADVSFEYLGFHAGNEGQTRDGISKVYWDDPADQVGTGTLGVTYTNESTGEIMTLGGETYYANAAVDIVFNDNVTWKTTEDIAAGACSGGISVESVATHEIGHLWGMGHTCEQEDICAESSHLEATMYWTASGCDLTAVDINSQDIYNFESLYGAYVGVSQIPGTAFGSAPLEVDWALEVEEGLEISEVFWRYGDGEDATVTDPADFAPSHTYTTQGQFTPSAEITGSTEACGEFTSSWSNLAGVLVCTVPEPVFSAEPHQGLQWQMVNLTDVSTYGCIDQVDWIIEQDGVEIDRVGAWSPKIEFPDAGDYTIVLEVEGPAGGGAAELPVSVRNTGGGCSAVPAGGFGLAGLLLGLGAVVRRRA